MGAFSFRKQLKLGHEGEDLFLSLNPGLKKLDGKIADFETPDGMGIELKSDSYDMSRTPNFFMERISNVEKGTPGGPWQALDKKVPVFVYWYPKHQHAFWFNTDELVGALEEIGPMRKHRVLNMGYRSEGWLIPRYYLQQIYTEVIYEH